MANPGGNYPGRQIFLGRLKNDLPAFAYFGSGRSEASKQRYATQFLEGENAIRMKPLDPNEKHDPFRHYQAVRIDPETGLCVVSNSQAPNDAVVEAYRFLPDDASEQSMYMEKLLAAIGTEYDNPEKPTSRIVGVLPPPGHNGILGITDKVGQAYALAISLRKLAPGTFHYVQTYDGNVEYSNMLGLLLTLKKTLFHSDATHASELANEIYDMSDYVDPKYGELRVWCVAGVRNGNGPGGWEIARRNRHNVG